MRKADDLIQRFLDSIGQTEGSDYIGLFGSWQPIVGERIAAHSQPVDVRGRTLIVEADHPGWVQMVMMRRGRIVDELRRRFPELGITGIAVRVVDRPGRTAPDPSARTVPTPDAASTAPPPPSPGTSQPSGSAPPSRDEVEALERIEDEELRDTLARLRDDLED